MTTRALVRTSSCAAPAFVGGHPLVRCRSVAHGMLMRRARARRTHVQTGTFVQSRHGFILAFPIPTLVRAIHHLFLGHHLSLLSSFFMPSQWLLYAEPMVNASLPAEERQRGRRVTPTDIMTLELPLVTHDAEMKLRSARARTARHLHLLMRHGANSPSRVPCVSQHDAGCRGGRRLGPAVRIANPRGERPPSPYLASTNSASCSTEPSGDALVHRSRKLCSTTSRNG